MRWIKNTLEKNGKAEGKTIESIADLVDGIVLAELVQALIPDDKLRVSLKPSTQKMVILGRLQTVLEFVASHSIRVTCSPSGM